MPVSADPSESLPAFSKLQASAVRLFAAKGYDGAHVSDIAREAGIRKSSVYAHCQSKEDLFMGLLRRVMAHELKLVGATLARDGLLAGLRRHFEELPQRFEEDPPCHKFVLKSIYTPPLELSGRVAALGLEFFPDLTELFKKAASVGGVPPERLESVADATLAVMDSVHVVSLYGPEFYGRRLDAVWAMYERHVTLA
jgi:AcrR family transcriptional regulator